MVIYDARTLPSAGKQMASTWLSETGERFLGGVRAEGIVVLFFESPSLGVFHIIYTIDDETGEPVDVTGALVEQAREAVMQ